MIGLVTQYTSHAEIDVEKKTSTILNSMNWFHLHYVFDQISRWV